MKLFLIVGILSAIGGLFGGSLVMILDYEIYKKCFIPKGKWIDHKCSQCGYLPSAEGETYFNYCPHCGADMEVE